MTFDKTTRALIFSKIEDIKEKLLILKKRAESKTEQSLYDSKEFDTFHEIEADILRGNLEQYKKALIENDYEFLN